MDKNIGNGNVVIDDLRFINEYEYLKSKGAIVIKLMDRVDIKDNHVSENMNIPYDYEFSSSDGVQIERLLNKM